MLVNPRNCAELLDVALLLEEEGVKRIRLLSRPAILGSAEGSVLPDSREEIYIRG